MQFSLQFLYVFLGHSFLPLINSQLFDNWLQGGDGLFNEILNGLLTSRFKTKYPPVPPDFMASSGEDTSSSVPDISELDAGTLPKNEDQSPLLLTSRDYESGIPSISMYQRSYIIVMMYLYFGFVQQFNLFRCFFVNGYVFGNCRN